MVNPLDGFPPSVDGAGGGSGTGPTGPTGPAGPAGPAIDLSSFQEGDVLRANAALDDVVPAAINDAGEETMFGKTGRFPSGSVRIGGVNRVSGGNDNVNIHNDSLNTFGIIVVQDQEGQTIGKIKQGQYSNLRSVTLQPLKDVTSSAGELIFPLFQTPNPASPTAIGTVDVIYQFEATNAVSDVSIQVFKANISDTFPTSEAELLTIGDEISTETNVQTVASTGSPTVLTTVTLRNPLGIANSEFLYVLAKGSGIYRGTNITWGEGGIPQIGGANVTVFTPHVIGQGYDVLAFNSVLDETFSAKDQLEALTDDDRLDASAVKNLPTAGTGLTEAQVQDIVGEMVMNNTETGIAVTYDGTGRKLNFVVQSGGFLQPIITGFSINIPNRVDLNTNLNGPRTVQYTAQHTSNISNAKLFIDNVEIQDLTTPTQEGSQSEGITLSGITTNSQKTIVFQIRIQDTNMNTIVSNNYSVLVQDVPDHELLYYGLNSSADFSSISLGSLTSSEITGSTIDVSTGATTQGQYFGILSPSNEDITSILDNVLSQEVLAIFTKTENVRNIGAESYDSYTIGPLNADPDGETYTITI